MSKIKHFINETVMYIKRDKRDFETALKLKGFVSKRYVPVCKWFEVIVEYKSPCDEAMRHLASSSRKQS